MMEFMNKKLNEKKKVGTPTKKVKLNEDHQ